VPILAGVFDDLKIPLASKVVKNEPKLLSRFFYSYTQSVKNPKIRLLTFKEGWGRYINYEKDI